MWAGYDCQNNTTVRRRPEAVGWAPLVCSGTTDYLLRDCGSVGTPAPGNGGTNEGAATQKPSVRQRGGDPKTDQQKEELSKQLGCEGKGPENPGFVAPLTSTSCRGNFWWDWTSTACGVLSRRHLEHFDNEFDLAGLKSFGCLEVDYVKPQKFVSSSPFVSVCSFWLRCLPQAKRPR